MTRFFSKVCILTLIAGSIASSCSCSGKTPEEELAATVCKMYDNIMECYGDGRCSADEFNRLYLTADYKHLIDSVNTFDSINCADMIGFWEYDHWIMAQDWDNPTYTLDTVFISDSISNWYWAIITIHNLGKDTKVNLLMMPENGEWKIGEMLNYDWAVPSETDNIGWYFRNTRNLLSAGLMEK